MAAHVDVTSDRAIDWVCKGCSTKEVQVKANHLGVVTWGIDDIQACNTLYHEIVKANAILGLHMAVRPLDPLTDRKVIVLNSASVKNAKEMQSIIDGNYAGYLGAKPVYANNLTVSRRESNVADYEIEHKWSMEYELYYKDYCNYMDALEKGDFSNYITMKRLSTEFQQLKAQINFTLHPSPVTANRLQFTQRTDELSKKYNLPSFPAVRMPANRSLSLLWGNPVSNSYEVVVVYGPDILCEDFEDGLVNKDEVLKINYIGHHGHTINYFCRLESISAVPGQRPTHITCRRFESLEQFTLDTENIDRICVLRKKDGSDDPDRSFRARAIPPCPRRPIQVLMNPLGSACQMQ